LKVSLYLDEDAQDSDLIQALTLHRVDVIGAWDAGMRQRDDDQHLEFATLHSRVLFGFNVRDYFRIHTEFLVLKQVACWNHPRKTTALLSWRANAPIAQTNRYEVGGRNARSG
jgi:hypothetical protein